MRILLAALSALVLAAWSAPARAEIGTADAVPAATLLLPYFEVDLGNPNGVDTLFTVNNASATSILANVTVWTDWGNPSLGFQIYLTGYDMQSIDLRTLFNGTLPRTADAGSDPGDTISHKGPLSQDINFPGAVGPCAFNGVYGNPDPTLALKIQNLQRVHQGLSSTIDGKCWGQSYGDSIARGYITVDTVNTCALSGPADVAYASVFLTFQNTLWGDYTILDAANNIADGDSLVAIEACPIPSVGNGAGHCPITPGTYSYYGRYAALSGNDQREPLPTTFAARYRIRTSPGQGTDLVVWRDTKRPPSGADGHLACGAEPSWFPLADSDVVAFDAAEQATDLCALANSTSPAAAASCFPLATQRVHVVGGNTIAADMGVPYKAGWLYLNLNHALASSDPFPDTAQAWVAVLHPDGTPQSGSEHGMPLDNALQTSGSGVTLIP